MAEGEASKRKRTTETQPDPVIALRFKSQLDEPDAFYRYRLDKRMRYLFSQYCKENNYEYETMRFFCNGQRINPSKTATELGLENGDEIDVMAHQNGGGHE